MNTIPCVAIFSHGGVRLAAMSDIEEGLESFHRVANYAALSLGRPRTNGIMVDNSSGFNSVTVNRCATNSTKGG